MKNKKGIFIVIGVIIAVVVSGIFLFTKQDKETSFTIFEKQWLENNKSKVIRAKQKEKSIKSKTIR